MALVIAGAVAQGAAATAVTLRLQRAMTNKCTTLRTKQSKLSMRRLAKRKAEEETRRWRREDPSHPHVQHQPCINLHPPTKKPSAGKKKQHFKSVFDRLDYLGRERAKKLERLQSQARRQEEAEEAELPFAPDVPRARRPSKKDESRMELPEEVPLLDVYGHLHKDAADREERQQQRAQERERESQIELDRSRQRDPQASRLPSDGPDVFTRLTQPSYSTSLHNHHSIVIASHHPLAAPVAVAASVHSDPHNHSGFHAPALPASPWITE